MLTFALKVIIAAVTLGATWRWLGRWNRFDTGYTPTRRDQPLIDAGPPAFDVRDWLNGRSSRPSRI